MNLWASTITITCWGCQKSETHPLLHGESFTLQQEELSSRGWFRRAFGPTSCDKGPWFCSQECAYESYNVKQAEAYWENKNEEDRQREFEKYCREIKIPQISYTIIAFIVGFALVQIIRTLLL